MQSSVLVVKRKGCPSFDPTTDIGDVSLWLDACDESTITVNSSKEVTEWRDKSGAGITGDFTPFDSERPISTVHANFINGRNVVRFQNDATDRALVSALAGDIKSATGYSYYVVFAPIDESGEEIVLFKGSSTPTEDLGNEFAAYTGTGGISHRVHTGDNSPIFGFTVGAQLSDSNVGYLSYVGEAPGTGIGSASIMTAYKNGSFDSSRSDWDSINDPPTNEGRPYYVGARYNDAQTVLSDVFKGDICEILVFDKPLTDPQRLSVDAYIEDKWGIVP